MDAVVESILPDLIEYSKKFIDLSDDIHGLGHIHRVISNAKKIHAIEGGNWPLITSLVWLHDIGRIFEKSSKKHHAIISNALAIEFLSSKIDQEMIDQISHGILAHSFSNGQEAKTLEAKILSDADKLDALGYIGIYRECAYQAKLNLGINAVIQHSDTKLLKLLDKIYLPYSKKLAKKRINIIKWFRNGLFDELN